MKKLLCIIGPSGSGKSTYVNYAINKFNYGEIISTTTRNPRIGEKDGKDYHFVSKKEFENLQKQNIYDFCVCTNMILKILLAIYFYAVFSF